MKNYRSSIPKAAQERVASNYISTRSKQRAEYVLDGKIVGVRWFDENGVMNSEVPWKHGLIHGNMYHFDDIPDGKLRVTFVEPYRNGLAHGTAKQWSEDATLIGTYNMKHGTGWDLWRHRKDFGRSPIRVLTEARYIKGGNWHGFELWFDLGQTTIHQEAHFWENLQHGIRREWNDKGKLRRGFPQYWVDNIRVTKRQYLRACSKDTNLPPFCASDDLPQRIFPLEVQAAIAETAAL